MKKRVVNPWFGIVVVSSLLWLGGPAFASTGSAPEVKPDSSEDSGGITTLESEDRKVVEEDQFGVEIQVDPERSPIASEVLKKLTDKGIIDEQDVVFKKETPRTVELKTIRDGGFNENVLVPIVALIVIFGMPVFIVAVISMFNYRKQKLFHESVNKLIEQGMDIPPELFDQFDGSKKPANHLKKGLVQVALGLSVFICLAFIADVDVATLGLIPLFLGFANLLIYKLDSHRPPEPD